MELQRVDDAAAFLELAGPFLLRNEAQHHLMLGISAGLARQPSGADPAPYLAACVAEGAVVAAALMTPPHNIILSQASVEALRLIARDLLATGVPLPGVHARVEEARPFVDIWQGLTGRVAEPGVFQRIYQLTRVIPPEGVPGEMRRATEADLPLLVEWVRAFSDEARDGADAAAATQIVARRLRDSKAGMFLWVDGEPVSLAGATGPTPHGIRIGPVYTPPERRRRGYGGAVTAALSQHLLDSGRRFCFLYTDQSNRTANHIYQAIGYEPVCEVEEYQWLSSRDDG